jgi:hypothetical protein
MKMPLCTKHGQVHGDGTPCAKCAQEKRESKQIAFLDGKPVATIVPRRIG